MHSADLNQIQDCIANNLHPPLEHGHAAGMWTLEANAAFDDSISADLVKFIDATGIARVSLGYVPIGDRVVTVTFGFHVAAPGVNAAVLMRLMSRPIGSSAAPTQVVAFTTGAMGIGDQTSTNAFNAVLATGLVYWLEAQLAGATGANNTWLVGASVVVDNL